MKMNDTDYIIGTVREIQGTSVIVRLFNESDQFSYFINGKRYSGILIGSYVGIKRGQYLIIGLIEKISAVDNLNDIENRTFSKNRFVRELTLKMIGAFHRRKFLHGMVAFPQIFNDVILLSDSQIHSVIAGDDLINRDSVEYFKLGKIWPVNVDYYLHWPDIFNTHIAIFGNTGSGKSNTLTKLYTSLFDLEKNKKLNFGDSKFYFLDFNGEYTKSGVLSDEKDVLNLTTRKKADKIDDNDKFHVPYNIFWDKDLLSIIFGATEQTQQPFLSRLIDFYFKQNNTFVESIIDYVITAFKEVYSSDANLDSLNLLKDVLNDLNILNNCFISNWINNSLVNKTTSNFYSRIDLAGWNYNPNQGLWFWNTEEQALDKEADIFKKDLEILNDIFNPFEELNNPILQLKVAAKLQMIHDLSTHTIQYDHVAPLLHRIEARSNDLNKVIFVESSNDKKDSINKNILIISLKNVNKDIKLLLPLLIAKVTYFNQKMTNSNHMKIFNLVIDEAHNILSERSSVESEKWKDYRLDVFEEIIKEGRKFGYYLTIASQRPADISSTIVSQVHNYFIHRLVNDNDLKMLQNTLSSLDYISRSSIPSLSPGQAIITGVSFKQPVIVQIDELEDSKKPDSSNTDLLNIWRN